MGLSDPSNVVLSAFIIFGLGFCPAIALKPGVRRVFLGLIVIMLAFVVDAFMTISYDLSQGDTNGLPTPIVTIVYGIIALGWLIGTAVSRLIRKE
jgi:hypothetical protein